MLAQNFKTPADLYISDVEFDALVKTLGMLERNELRHVKNALEPIEVEVEPHIREFGLFNMNWWGDKFECGTVCCIGATVEAVMKRKFENSTPQLCDLFWHQAALENTTTPEQAAMAVRNYLTYGQARWGEILGED